MKIAGRKNDGAWYRANKFIRHTREANPDQLQNLRDQLATMGSLAIALVALKDMAQAAGLDATNPDIVPQDSQEWAGIFTDKGIPRQIWTGELSLDVYLPPNSDGNTKDYYVKKHGEAFRQLGIDIRYTVTHFQIMLRQVADLQNVRTRAQGNPGGVADATKNT